MDIKQNPEQFKKLESIFEFSTYFVIVFSLVFISLYPDPTINKTAIYILAIPLTIYSLIHYHLIPSKFEVGGKTLYRIYLKEVINIIFMTILIHFTGSLSPYFFLLYIISLIALSLSGTLFETTLVTSSIILFYSIEVFWKAGWQIPQGPDLAHWLLQITFILFLGFFVRRLAKIVITEFEEKERMKKFISLVSHELRTPVATMEGYFSLLEEMKKNDTLKPFLRDGHKASLNLMDLINNILELSTVRTEKLFKKETDLREIINDVVKQRKKYADEKNLKLIYQTPQNPLIVNVDPGRIRVAVNHLIDNAVKFTEKGEIVVKLESTPKEILFSVQDTGTGISKNDLPHIFEEFYCIEDILHGKKQGFGLGLPVCKKILEDYDGKIWVKSEKDKGTKVSFSLPKI